ncbi:MAG TPA: formyltransferase family protein [Candidatus Paceibacterota bacterium]|nr:formyltransferase family protein [Candidatus Paceibacterota bacterium]
MNSDLRLVFLGATRFSEAILQHLLKCGFRPSILFTIPEDFSISYSQGKVHNYNYSDLRSICEREEIPLRIVDSCDGGHKLSDYKDEIRALRPDVILTMGWYYMVPRSIRELARWGAWGIHASLLPAYAGGAPLVWAIIEGQEQTGVTLFRFDDGVDDGDIIAQRAFPIHKEDTIREVYRRATTASKSLLVRALKALPNVTFCSQDKSKIKVYPQRKPQDGEIDLKWDADRMYNFIRAQSSPYPGAFIRTAEGRKLIIEKARVVP